MKNFISFIHTILFALAAFAITTDADAETQTLHYPSLDATMFSIEAPADWRLSEIQEVGEFGTLESANGSVLQFRAIECESEDEARKEIDEIFDSTAKFLETNYTDIQLDEPKEIAIEGQPGAQLTGTGKDKNGNPVTFLSAMVALGPTTISEVWAAAYPEEIPEAQAVLQSFKPTGSAASE